MLRCAFFRDFKGANTLLVWGNNDDAVRLRAGLLAFREDQRAAFCVEGGPGLTRLELQLLSGDGLSRIRGTEEDVVWSCSREALSHAIAIIEPLTTASDGHQYVDVRGGLASQIVISVNEYPESLRR